MFWAERDTLEMVCGLGVRYGQLGVPGGMHLTDAAAGQWKTALGKARFTLVTVFAAYPGEDYTDLPAVARTVGFVPPVTRAARLARTFEVSDFAAQLGVLFPGMEILEAHPFHVTRDADMAITELEAEDLLETVEEGLRQRRFQSVVRLLVTADMPGPMLNILMNNLEIGPSEVYRSPRPLSLKRLMSLHGLDRPDLREAPFLPAVPPELAELSDEEDIFAMIRNRDILVHHPFDSFQPVIEFLRKAARDPAVLAIKTCLYRVGRNAPVVEALLEAVEEDKQVAALVELKARFDEESNIEWARALERTGVHVVYGLIGLKIHCKVALVVRREKDRIARYVHLSTGNYNAITAHLYTDIGLFTCDEAVADDVSDLFNYLTGYSHKADYLKLLVAPVNMRSKFEALIEREIKHAKSGGKAHLIFKMNSLVDSKIIRALYKASQAGVRIQLLVRGICCLRPGVPGVSDHIEVTSIVGRFLEHSRVFYFRNGGHEEVYLSSADWMVRNLDKRLELFYPIQQPDLVKRLIGMLGTFFADNGKSRRLLPDGTYEKVPRGRPAIRAQEHFHHEAVEAVHAGRLPGPGQAQGRFAVRR